MPNVARRRRARVALNADINVVNLIDVMLLLLVIFMITAPMMQGGVDIALPKAEARPLESKGGLVVTVREPQSLPARPLMYQTAEVTSAAAVRKASCRAA